MSQKTWCRIFAIVSILHSTSLKCWWSYSK